jgi:primosomal protein N' (replication factor Y)
MMNSDTSNQTLFQEELGMIDVADVSVDIEAPDLLPVYSYRIPDEWKTLVKVGSRVAVPFGSQEKRGYVMCLKTISLEGNIASRLKELNGVVEDALTFNEEQAAIAKWVSERYVSDLIHAIHCIAPSVMLAKEFTLARLTDLGMMEGIAEKSVPQAHLLAVLRSLGGEAELETFRKAASLSSFSSAYSALKKKGIITESRFETPPQAHALLSRAVEPGPKYDNPDEKISPAGNRILQSIRSYADVGQVPVARDMLLKSANASIGALKTLIEKSILAETHITLRRSATNISLQRTEAPSFTLGQRSASLYLRQRLENLIDAKNAERHAVKRTALLFGVTASGKTEVYLNAIEKTLETGRNAIVLVPEIALTTQVTDIFTGRFGDEVAVLHSRLSEGERHDEWIRLQKGQARIAIGARSAVFAPLENVGLIIMDEEHEASYKQESLPRYHTRDVAIERARLSGALTLLGSATPSIETYHEAKSGKIALLEMSERIGKREMPTVQIVDMREEWKKNRALFGARFVEELSTCLTRRQQAILFLNRRGYGQFILCRDCGYVAKCPNCEVSLAYHASANTLQCHHCDYIRKAPKVCPDCKGERIKSFGIGTEKVEEEVLKYFPHARILRMDRDTTSRKGAHADIIAKFRRGDADILIGTQMVAKGLDFPRVTFVGVVSADTTMNMPDFRAGERTFQLLTQVAGRAGRGHDPGMVIIQTFNPDHYSIQKALKQDYPGFYEEEIGFRRELLYPPFRRFANLIVSDTSEDAAKQRAEGIAEALQGYLPEDTQLIGPAPAPMSRLNGKYRFHLLLRCDPDMDISSLTWNGLKSLSQADKIGLIVDVDPLNMM